MEETKIDWLEKVRKPTRYNPETHVPMVFNNFIIGGGRAEFCSEAFISKRTFYEWIRKYKEFELSVEIAIEMAEKKWNALHPDFPVARWEIVMKNRFGITSERRLSVPKIKNTKDIVGCMEAIMSELKDGNLTSKEISSLSSLIASQLQLNKAVALEERIAKLESKEG